MTHDTQPPRSEIRWSDPRPAQPAASAFTRFIGGAPGVVALRLLVVSLVVGALLMWLDIRPWEVLRAVERLFLRLWAMGFDAVREIVAYIVAGAVIVVPAKAMT